MEKTFVRFGNEKLFFDVPPGWKILTQAEFKDHPQDREAAHLTRRGLSHPIGALPLPDQVRPTDRVSIIIEDLTRASPKKIVLRALLDLLNEAGVPKDHITVVVALGTHRALSQEELEDGYGADAVRDVLFINHDCLASDLVPVGTLETGTTVKINRTVHEATFRIGIGSIFPHPLNGFGGGCKILFPGVGDFDSILEHHLKYSFRGGSELGRLEGNPFYDEVCQVARSGGLDFIINSVLDHNDRLYEVVCGDPIQAHRAGADICRDIISLPFKQKADVTIISSFPYSEGPQIMKPLAPASMITKKGGVIILAARMTSPLPDLVITGCEQFRSQHPGRLKECLFEHFDQNLRLIDDSAPEHNMCMSQALLALNDYTIILLSNDIIREDAERLGFRLAEDMDQAFAMAADIVTAPDVHVVPAGGVILPLL